MTLLLDLDFYKNLKIIRLINKGAFFNLKLLMGNEKIKALGIFNKGYTVDKIKDDSSKLLLKFKLIGEPLERTLELTFLNY